jgi:hypothetical protein
MYLDLVKIVENCPHIKYLMLIRNDMKLILKVLTRRYTSATYIFMFEINFLKVVIICFIKGSQNF